MKTKDGYEQAYNCQAAVDAESQVIVARRVGNEQNDHDALEPLVDQVKAHTGEYPAEVSADTGYCSESNLESLEKVTGEWSLLCTAHNLLKLAAARSATGT